MVRGVGRSAAAALAAALLLVATSCTSGSGDQGSTVPSNPASIPSAVPECAMSVDQSASQTHAAFFSGVSAAGPKDVWAVGTQFYLSRPGPLIERWDGASWKSMIRENDRENGLQLTDVAAVDPNDVWAVGFVYGGASVFHWDGSRFTQISTAPQLAKSNLLGVRALGSDDIWAVGITPSAGGYDQPLIQHMAGSTWSIVPAPATGGYSAGLRDVDAAGPDSVWAAGWTVGSDRVYRPLVERRVGDRWVISPTPKLADDATLSGLAVAGPKDVWAVGWSWKDDGSRSLVLHWNGSRWDVLHVTGAAGSSAHLATVAIDGRDVITAGQSPDAEGVLQPVAFRLHGDTWTSNAGPAGSDGGGFQGITGVDDGGMVAVGIQWSEEGYGSLVQRGC
jgi:hypothetical protein